MIRHVALLTFIVVGITECLIVVSLLSIGLFGIIEEPEATVVVKKLFLVGAGFFPLFMISRWFIKCDNCRKNLVTFNNFDGKSVSWDNLFFALFSSKPVFCPHCRHPNFLKRTKS